MCSRSLIDRLRSALILWIHLQWKRYSAAGPGYVFPGFALARGFRIDVEIVAAPRSQGAPAGMLDAVDHHPAILCAAMGGAVDIVDARGETSPSGYKSLPQGKNHGMRRRR